MPHDITTSFFLAMAIGLVAFWLTSLIRAPAWVQPLLIAGTKPLACNACMSLWSTVLLLLAVAGLSWWLIEPGVVNWWLLAQWPVSGGLCLWLLESTHVPPFSLGKEDSDEQSKRSK